MCQNLRLNISPEYIYTTFCLLIHQLINTWVSYHLLATVNDAVMNIGVERLVNLNLSCA